MDVIGRALGQTCCQIEGVGQVLHTFPVLWIARQLLRSNHQTVCLIYSVTVP